MGFTQRLIRCCQTRKHRRLVVSVWTVESKLCQAHRPAVFLSFSLRGSERLQPEDCEDGSNSWLCERRRGGLPALWQGPERWDRLFIYNTQYMYNIKSIQEQTVAENCEQLMWPLTSDFRFYPKSYSLDASWTFPSESSFIFSWWLDVKQLQLISPPAGRFVNSSRVFKGALSDFMSDVTNVHFVQTTFFHWQ